MSGQRRLKQSQKQKQPSTRNQPEKGTFEVIAEKLSKTGTKKARDAFAKGMRKGRKK
jgi:hypothetical protein